MNRNLRIAARVLSNNLVACPIVFVHDKVYVPSVEYIKAEVKWAARQVDAADALKDHECEYGMCTDCDKPYVYTHGVSDEHLCFNCKFDEEYYATHTLEGVQVLDENDLKENHG